MRFMQCKRGGGKKGRSMNKFSGEKKSRRDGHEDRETQYPKIEQQQKQPKKF